MSDQNGNTPKEKPRTAELTEYLRYDFTQAELLEHAQTLGRLNQERARSEERKKAVTKELASEVERFAAEVARESRLVTQGYEYRDIRCEVRYHDPEKGKKTIVRLDSGEVVRTAFMTGEEMQEAFDFEPPAEVMVEHSDPND